MEGKKTQLAICAGTARAGKHCTKTVSLSTETHCPQHGGKKKDGTYAKKRTKPVAKYTCGDAGGVTQAGNPCKRSVREEGALCKQHDTSVAPQVAVLNLHAMNKSFIQAFSECGQLQLMQDCARWWCDGNDMADDHGQLTEEEWARWITSGCSNANGNSFGEKYNMDPITFVCGLGPMEPFAELLKAKFAELASLRHVIEVDVGGTMEMREQPVYGAVCMYWERSQGNCGPYYPQQGSEDADDNSN